MIADQTSAVMIRYLSQSAHELVELLPRVPLINIRLQISLVFVGNFC